MHVKRFDGSDYTTPHTDRKMRQALADPEVASVDVVKPGGVITRSNGRRYRLNTVGQWERIDKEPIAPAERKQRPPVNRARHRR